MLGLLALAVTGACAWASFRRLRFAVAPTTLDPKTMLRALREGGAGREALERAVSALRDDAWERMLFDAVRAPLAERAGRVNEALSELDQLAQRWARVPRVCASIASTTSFLLASMALRAGLTSAGAAPDETLGEQLNATITDAINVAAVGIAGAAFCIAVQYRARRAVKEQMEATDKLVERLEAALAA